MLLTAVAVGVPIFRLPNVLGDIGSEIDHELSNNTDRAPASLRHVNEVSTASICKGAGPLICIKSGQFETPYANGQQGGWSVQNAEVAAVRSGR
jgi:hypothetical protein